jgi:hypothetical protein
MQSPALVGSSGRADRRSLPIPRIPGYTDRMNAKTRYRQRLKLQVALTRVMELLATHAAEEIPPDRTTALMAWQLVLKLLLFIEVAGIAPRELQGRTDPSRFLHLKMVRKRATQARYRRRQQTRPAGAG